MSPTNYKTEIRHSLIISSYPEIVSERIYYRPQTKLQEGNVSTGVCDSVHEGVCAQGCLVGGGGCLLTGHAWSGEGGVCSEGDVWSRSVPGERLCSRGGAWSEALLPGGCLVETPPVGYCCGRYASYWNAFLLACNALR